MWMTWGEITLTLWITMLHIPTIASWTECNRCTPGHYASHPCTALGGIQCTPCPEGTYTTRHNTLSGCIPCTRCDQPGSVAVRRCNATQDSVCQICNFWTIVTNPALLTSCGGIEEIPQGAESNREEAQGLRQERSIGIRVTHRSEEITEEDGSGELLSFGELGALLVNNTIHVPGTASTADNIAIESENTTDVVTTAAYEKSGTVDYNITGGLTTDSDNETTISPTDYNGDEKSGTTEDYNITGGLTTDSDNYTTLSPTDYNDTSGNYSTTYSPETNLTYTKSNLTYTSTHYDASSEVKHTTHFKGTTHIMGDDSEEFDGSGGSFDDAYDGNRNVSTAVGLHNPPLRKSGNLTVLKESYDDGHEGVIENVTPWDNYTETYNDTEIDGVIENVTPWDNYTETNNNTESDDDGEQDADDAIMGPVIIVKEKSTKSTPITTTVYKTTVSGTTLDLTTQPSLTTRRPRRKGRKRLPCNRTRSGVGSQDDDDGGPSATLWIIIAAVLLAAVLFFLIGFLIARSSMMKRYHKSYKFPDDPKILVNDDLSHPDGKVSHRTPRPSPRDQIGSRRSHSLFDGPTPAQLPIHRYSGYLSTDSINTDVSLKFIDETDDEMDDLGRPLSPDYHATTTFEFPDVLDHNAPTSHTGPVDETIHANHSDTKGAKHTSVPVHQFSPEYTDTTPFLYTEREPDTVSLSSDSDRDRLMTESDL